MTERYLEVTYQKGRPLAAYLYLPRAASARSVRSVQAGAGLLVDYGSGGEAIGLEITAPAQVTVEQVNSVLQDPGPTHYRTGRIGAAPGSLSLPRVSGER